MPTANGETVPWCGVLNVYADGAPAAWGARLIVSQDGHVDLVPDRQGSAGADQPEFMARLGAEFPMWALREKVRDLLAAGRMDTRAGETLVLYQSAGLEVRADTRGSGGYCYVVAFTRTVHKGE